MAVPLADANTSATPSLAIWAARSVDDPKLNVTAMPPSLPSSNAAPISVNASVSDDAAKTVSSSGRSPSGALEVSG
jgi:hypothetical protein